MCKLIVDKSQPPKYEQDDITRITQTKTSIKNNVLIQYAGERSEIH